MIPYDSHRYYSDQRWNAGNRPVHHNTRKENILRRTAKAVLLQAGDVAVWLPLSRIEITATSEGSVTVTLPLWLAKRKGLAYERSTGKVPV